jgi:hypothetical protein
VYHLIMELIERSTEQFKTKEGKALLKWHLTVDKHHYFKLLGTFIKSYLKTTVRGKRSILQHMTLIGYDFSRYVDLAFKNFLTNFVSLPIALDILMMYLNEGVKIVFRYAYAVIKANKEKIKACSTKEELEAFFD